MSDNDNDDFDPWGNDATDWFGDGDDEGDDGNDDDGGAALGAQHILVLVDSSEDMYVPCIPVADADGSLKRKRMSHDNSQQEKQDEPQQPLMTPMDMALKCCEGFLRRRLRQAVTRKTGARDGFGLMVYGTRQRPPIVRSSNNQDATNGTPQVGRKHDESDDESNDDDDDEDSGSDTSVHRRGASRFGAATTAHMLIPLEPPGLDAVQTLRHCLVEHPVHGRRIDLHSDYGHANNDDDDNSKPPWSRRGNRPANASPLHTAFQDARKIFKDAKCVKKIKGNKPDEPHHSKTIWIFTNRDLPYVSDNNNDNVEKQDEEEKRKEMNALALVLTMAQDLIDGGFTLQLWPLKHPTQSTFQRNLFYDKFCRNPGVLHHKHSMDDEHQQRHENLMDLTELMDAMVASFKKWRRTICVPLLLPDFLDAYQQAKKQQEHSSIDNDDDDDQQQVNAQDPYPGIMLDFFNMALIQKKPTRVWVDRRTGEEIDKYEVIMTNGGEYGGELLTQRKMTNVTTTEREQFQQHEGLKRLRQFAKIGGELVPLSREDVAELKMRSNANHFFASLILLGFKKPDEIPFCHNLAKSWFVYPNDDYNDLSAPNACSSSEAFAHLHAAMRRKNVVGIGELLTRRTATSRLVAIHAIEPPPLNEGQHPQIQHKIPAGMVVVQLPFEEEIRFVDPDPAAERQAEELRQNDDGKEDNIDRDATSEILVIPPALTDAVQELVEKQTLPDGIVWDEDFKNASLEYYWDSLEYGALGEQLPSDKKYMIAEAIDGHDLREALGEYIDNVRDALPEEPVVVRTRKRPGPSAIKVVDDTNIDWEEYYSNNELHKVKNKDLQTKLASLGLPKTGNKAALVDRLETALASQIRNGGKI